MVELNTIMNCSLLTILLITIKNIDYQTINSDKPL